MIKSKQDYLDYLEADRIALEKPYFSFGIYLKECFTRELVWQFQRLLRKTEYYGNVISKRSFAGKIAYSFIKFRFKNLSIKLGFSIPENIFGPGLAIVHYGSIVINSSAKIGANCRIHVGVNIGESGGMKGAPVLGNNIYIGPGAKIFGDIFIADNCAIAANAAINKSVKEEGMLIGGVPGHIIKPIDIKLLIRHLK
jgi:serine O-acetyltransferase